ncbi:MAG: hypothetical protein HS126_35225 [Anaerolineales bacterium]|nr:hypothetical protein [Anaerolineales bacterium]
MLHHTILTGRIKKLFYGWLIFCVGGVSSLAYFDGFAPGHEHGQHPYHLSIFDEAAHAHNPLPPLHEDLTEQMRFWLASRLNPQADFFVAAQNLGVGFSRFFASGLGDGYILTAAYLKIFGLPSLFGSVERIAFKGRSAWPIPLDKPPIFLG